MGIRGIGRLASFMCYRSIKGEQANLENVALHGNKFDLEIGE